MKISPITNYQYSNRQSFGAKLSKSTVAFIEEAKSKGLDTSKMEKLMEEVYPNETIYTRTEYDPFDHKRKLLWIGTDYRDFDYSPEERTTVLRNPKTCIFGLYISHIQDIDQKLINMVTDSLERIKEDEE